MNTTFNCRYCQHPCIKKGIRNGSQCYQCSECKRYQKANYTYRSYEIADQLIKQCVKEGLGIRSMSRLLGISSSTVIRRIRFIARLTIKPPIPIMKHFEVDELHTFIGRKSSATWIVLALEKETRRVVDFYVGPRTQKSLRMVVNTLICADAKRIYTDGLSLYKGLIAQQVHEVVRYGTNRVERFNLSLRLHLKRLNRRSIAFSRSLEMLNCVLIIYLWG